MLYKRKEIHENQKLHNFITEIVLVMYWNYNLIIDQIDDGLVPVYTTCYITKDIINVIFEAISIQI